MSVLDDWRTIPAMLDRFVARGPLDDKVDDAMTRRELVHHIVEANVVAAAILVAALGAPGSTFDWSWMMPFGPWLERMSYKTKPIEPSLALVHALNAYVVAQIEPLADALDREVLLRDTPGGEPRRSTVAGVLQQEIDHARGHLATQI
jgi:hypothetical protein